MIFQFFISIVIWWFIGNCEIISVTMDTTDIEYSRVQCWVTCVMLWTYAFIQPFAHPAYNIHAHGSYALQGKGERPFRLNRCREIWRWRFSERYLGTMNRIIMNSCFCYWLAADISVTPSIFYFYHLTHSSQITVAIVRRKFWRPTRALSLSFLFKRDNISSLQSSACYFLLGYCCVKI